MNKKQCFIFDEQSYDMSFYVDKEEYDVYVDIDKILCENSNLSRALPTDFAISLGCNKIDEYQGRKYGQYWISVDYKPLDIDRYAFEYYQKVSASAVRGMCWGKTNIYKDTDIWLDNQISEYNPTDHLNNVGFRPFLVVYGDIPFNPNSKVKITNDLLEIQYGFYPQQSPLI